MKTDGKKKITRIIIMFSLIRRSSAPCRNFYLVGYDFSFLNTIIIYCKLIKYNDLNHANVIFTYAMF